LPPPDAIGLDFKHLSFYSERVACRQFLLEGFMAANAISSSRISTPLDSVQAANQRETRAHREQQRAQQASSAESVEREQRSNGAERAVQTRVEKNSDTQRSRAQANDDATALQRRAAQAADKHAEQERRQGEKTLGRHIDTTA